MSDNEFQYPGGNDLGITLNLYWQMEMRELSTDGFQKEYEDMLDHELLTLIPLAAEIERDGEIWELLESGLGESEIKDQDRIRWGREKRLRCWKKKRLAMELSHEFRFLVSRTAIRKADMDDYDKLFSGKL